MSKTIDEKVVEMRFDNKHFEANVSTTLSTLDKLKAKLNLTGASKGLEEVNKASKKVDFSHMESSIAALEKRFSTTGIVGMTVIQNLTNSVIEFTKKLSSFSIGGILEGGKSRATKIENARFQIKGLLRDYEDAQQRLDDIMADVNYGVESTAYGLDAAASVAAQLVASGIQAGDGMKAALRGISGVAAMTNSTYEDIGRIYTTVAGNGRLMGDQLLQLSARGMNAAAVLAKSLGKTEAEVREMTSKGKISFEMFSKAMNDAFGEHAKDANKTLNGVLSNIRAALSKIGADFYGPLIAENSPLVLFLNSVRERINEIRKTLAPITKEITDRINNFITSLNKLFTDKNLFGYNPLANMAEKIQSIKDVINGATTPIKKAAEIFDKAGHSLQDYEKLVDEIIYGKWKNQPVRQQLLEEAGWNYYKAQNMVNEKLGNSFRYADEYVQTTEQATTSTAELAAEVENLSDEQMRNMGFTEEQIEAFNELKKMAKKTGIPIKELIELISAKDGKDNSIFSTRYLLLNSLKNIGFTLVSIFKSIGKAFGEVFNVKPEGLFDLIAAFHKLTALLRDRVEKNAEKLTSTFKGLFSIIHLITTIVGGAFKLGLKIINKVLESFGLSLLDVTAIVGEAIYRFEQWITSNKTIVSIGKAFIEVLVATIKYIISIVEAIKDWITHNEKIMNVINKIKDVFNNAGDATKAWFEGLKETDNIPEYIFGGLINGIKENGPKVFNAIIEVAKGMIEAFQNIFKIHSPSKVMFAMGGFIIAGLTAGLLSGSIQLEDIISGISNKIIALFSQIDLGNVIAVGISAGIIYLAKRMFDIADALLYPIEALSNVLNGLGNVLTGLGSAATDFGKSMKYQGIAAIIKSIALSIGILAASLWILAKLPADQLKQGGIALGIIGAALAGFVILTAALSNRLTKVKLPDVGKILAAVLGISVGMLIMSKALKNVSKIDPYRMTSSIFGLIGCAAAMAILIVTLGKVTESLKGTKNIEKMGKVFGKMAFSMLLISVALRMMSKVELTDLYKMAGVIGGMIVLLTAIGLINKFTENSITKSAETIKAVGMTLLLLVFVIKLSAGLKPAGFVNATLVVGLFIGLLTTLMLISKKFKGTEMVKVTGSILMVALAIGALALITKLMSNMDPKKMLKGIGCVTALSIIIAGLIKVSKNSASLHGTTMVGVAMLIASMGVAVFLLGQLDPEKAWNGLKAVGIISAFVAILLQSAKNFNPGKDAVKTLISLTVMLSLLAVALVGLSFIDQSRLMTTARSLGVVMLALAGVIAATSKLKVKKGLIKDLALITLVVAAMAGIVTLLSFIPNIERAVQGSIGIAILMGSLLTMTLALSKIDGRKNINKKFIIGLYSLIPLLVGIAAALSIAGNTQNSIQNALSISILLVAMTGVLAGLTAIGKFLGKEMFAGIAGLTVLLLELYIAVDILRQMDGLQNAAQNCMVLGLFVGILSLALLALAGVGAIYMATFGLAATGLIGLFVLLKELYMVVDILKQMQDIKNVMPNVLALTLLLGALTDCLFKISLVGPLALIADAAIFGLIGAITTIGILATSVGIIMDKFPQLQEFLNKGLPVLELIALSIGKIIGNVVAGFTSSIADELPHLGTKLSEFMENAKPFIDIAQTINDNVGRGAKALIAAVVLLSGANVLEAITTFLSGGESFGRLGTELSKFAISALPFLAVMSTVDPKVMEGAKNLASAVMSFTAGNFINSLTGWLTGDNDLGAFGEKLAPLGTGLSQFVSNLGTFTDDQVATIQCACEALKSIADAASKLPNEGGVAAFFAGDNDLATYSEKLPKAGEGLRKFVKELTADGVFDESKVNIVKAGCEALKTISEVAANLPNEGGVAAFFAGDNDISKFAGKLGDVGKSLRGFVYELQKDNIINDKSIDKINAVNNIMWAISDLGKINLGDTSGKLEELGARLGSFGNKITEYVKGINTISLEDLQSSKEKIDKVIEIANILSTVSSEPIEKLGETLKKFAIDAINKFVAGLNDAKPQEDAKNAIIAIVDKMLEALKSKNDDVNTGALTIIETATKALESNDHKTRATIAGVNLLSGFIQGMNDKDGKVWNAAYAIGKKAVTAINKATDEHSPSKETFKTGKFFDEGFINGIKSLQNKIYDESYGIGDKAKLGLGRAIKGVSDLISEGIDDEFTIRPVLDLSDVRSGAALINGMLGTPSVGLAANLNSISCGMNRKSQNSGNDIVSAIDNLGKHLGNTTGDTYNINGINVDSDSDVADAIQTLVDAARVGRRV